MPSLEHAALVEMFRTHPELIPLLLHEALGVTVPAYQTLSVTEAALDQLVPIEFRADLVVEFLAENNKRPVLSSIVEVQLRIDEAKYFSWPVYVTVERSRKRCDTCLIVVAPDPAVAAWARGPIRIGPGNELRPIVLGPAEIPIVTDREVGLANPILAVLSALAHGNEPEHGLPIVRVALEALAGLDSADSGIYAHILFKALAEPVSRALRNEAMLRDVIPEDKLEGQFLLKIVDGYRALHARERRARALGEATMLLKIIDHNGLALTNEQRHTIETCEDRALIDRWADRAFDVKTAAELFA